MRRYIFAGILTGLGLLSGCADETPTSTSPDLVPLSPRTVEIRLPLDQIDSEVRLFRGFGSTSGLDHSVVARDFNGALNARTLARFRNFPVAVEVPDTTGAVVTDSSITFVGGRVVAHVDTAGLDVDSIANRFGRPVFRASSLDAPWHPPSATWEFAVDTSGDRRPWPEAGAGPATEIETDQWQASLSDSMVFRVDSATVADWTDTTNPSRGVRIDAETSGLQVPFRDVSLLLETRPSANPDTIVFAEAEGRQLTFVYDPSPEAPENGIRFGGVPAWRTSVAISVPDTLNGPPEACAALGGCPYRVTPEALSFASLVLVSREAPPAFQLGDTLRLDMRPVFRPDLLPKSPLGSSLFGPLRRALPPGIFSSSGAGESVELPLTGFVRDLIRGETASGGEARNTLVLLTANEPDGVALGDFYGPGSDSPPALRLVITDSEGVDLP